jgi:hypothetical protein
MGAVVTDPPGVPSMRRVSVSDPRLSGHPQIWSEAFSAGSGVGSFGSVGFSGKDVHVARLRALSAALLTAALLSAVLGCEDEPEPDIADPTQSATAPSPSETESSPTTSPTPEALTPEETVRAWVDAQNQALETGDTDRLRAFGTEDCVGCSDYPDGIEQIYEAGGSFDGGAWTFVQGRARDLEDGVTRFSAGISIAAGTTIAAEGAEPVSYPAESRIFVFDMVKQSVAWRFTRIVVTK